MLVFGEGWHNNHHAFPASARHGLHRFQIDLSWWIIRGLEKLRLVSNVRLPTKAQMRRRARGFSPRERLELSRDEPRPAAARGSGTSRRRALRSARPCTPPRISV